MKNFNLITVLIFTLMMVMTSCGKKSSTMWVSGYKYPCSMGAGKGECLQVNKSSNPNSDEWINFSAPIDGFTFEPGVMQQIRYQEEKIDNPPADGSSIRYAQVEVIKKQKDHKAFLEEGQWMLKSWGDGEMVEESRTTPRLQFMLEKMTLGGKDGCNTISNQIVDLGFSSLKLGQGASTKKMCPDMAIPKKFDAMLSEVAKYDVNSTTLNLYDKGMKKLAVFTRTQSNVSMDNSQGGGTANMGDADPRINDIWVGVGINGGKLNRMTNMPRLQFNFEQYMVLGNDSCNQFSGPLVSIDAKNIKIGNLISTQKMCRDMERADAFMKALQKVSTYEVDNGQLHLFDSSNTEVLTFIKADY